MIGLDHPAWLAALLLAPLPLAIPLLTAARQPALGAGPGGREGRALEAALRGLGALAIGALVLGLAGPWIGGGSRPRIGEGAHLVLLIDRSLSMNDSFAGRAPEGADEAKAAAAKRLLTDFVAARPHDRIAVAAFSTAPIPVLPMTDRHAAVAAAIAAIDEPGLAKTDVGRGLALAFSMFDDTGEDAARAVILVSDGAGLIPRLTQEALIAEATRQRPNLYWLYLRTRNAKGIFDKPAPGEPDTAQARPERHLNLFLERLNIPYRAFEAENPEDVARAIAEIDRLEAKPLVYREPLPRRALGHACFAVATCAILLLTAARLLEQPPAPRPRGRFLRARGPS
jgi:mxaC protein